MRNATINNIKQKGVVLFVALIALVVMSLAAVALIRSVDTNTIIAGNMALKHSALVSSDRGVETALVWLEEQAEDSPEILYVDNAAGWYHATMPVPELDLKAGATWATAGDATGDGIVGGEEASSGNKINFIIERMCQEDGEAREEVCLLGDPERGNGSNKVVSGDLGGAEINAEASPVYRITTRVKGTKNTFSYTQTFVY